MTLTIFTPTYNRGYILPELYKSLCNQTSQCFKWLIVDDGSSDNTRELVKSWITENKISITYIYQKNQGKMQAHNTGVLSCDTDLFLCVDSDDYITENTVDDIINIDSDLILHEDIAGIISYRGSSGNEVIGTEFPNDIIVSKLNNLYKYGFKGDTTIILKTKILKGNLFPRIDGEKFITESYIYDKIDIKYSYILLRKIHIVCKYRDDGYTKNILTLMNENPIGFMLYYHQRAQFEKNIFLKIKYLIQYLSYALFNIKRLMSVNFVVIIFLFPYSFIYKLRMSVKYMMFRIKND